MIEELKEYVEDMIIGELYGEFGEEKVDAFIREYSEDVVSPEVQEIIEALVGAISERFDTLVEEIEYSDDKDDDEEVPF